MNMTEAAKKLGVSKETIQRWMDKGLLKTTQITECPDLAEICHEEMAAHEAFAELQKSLDECRRELRNEVAKTRKQIIDFRLLHSANAEIQQLNKMTATIMTKMWRLLSLKMDISEQNAKMVEMALQGCSSSYIANKMEQKPSDVQFAIKEALAELDKVDVECDLMDKINTLERQNKKLTEQNDVLTKNVETLRKCCNTRIALYEVTEEQKRVLMTSILDTGLPFRVIHAMTFLKVNRVIDLVRLSIEDMRNAKNIGVKSINTIIHYLGMYDLQLNTYVYVDAQTKAIKLSYLKEPIQEDFS